METFRVQIKDRMDRIFNFGNIYYENEVMIWLLHNYTSEISEVELRSAKITKLY